MNEGKTSRDRNEALCSYSGFSINRDKTVEKTNFRVDNAASIFFLSSILLSSALLRFVLMFHNYSYEKEKFLRINQWRRRLEKMQNTVAEGISG
jgi:hypothetical protein